MRLTKFEFWVMNNPLRRYIQKRFEFRLFQEMGPLISRRLPPDRDFWYPIIFGSVKEEDLGIAADFQRTHPVRTGESAS